MFVYKGDINYDYDLIKERIKEDGNENILPNVLFVKMVEEIKSVVNQLIEVIVPKIVVEVNIDEKVVNIV